MSSNQETECTPTQVNNCIDYQAKSMSKIIFSQFLEHRFAVIGAVVICFFIVIAIFAPMIAKITRLSPSSQNMFHRYEPPWTTLPYTAHMIETNLKKYGYNHPEFVEDIKNYLKTTDEIDTSEVYFELEPDEFLYSLYDILDYDEEFKQGMIQSKHAGIKKFIRRTQSFQTFHLLGTDELGRDVLIRLIYGARVSIGVGLLVAISGAIIGLIIGSTAGFYGGVIDNILMRITDSLISLPLLPVMIVLCAVDLKKIPFLGNLFDTGQESIFKLVFVLTVFSWMTVARLIRGNILSLKEKDFVHAAKTLGARDSFIIRVHLIPNVIAPLLVAVTVNVGFSILMEAVLSFLGLGIQPPIPSWGNMLNNAMELVYQAPALAIAPGFLIFIVVISFNFFGDGLQDAVNPQAIRR